MVKYKQLKQFYEQDNNAVIKSTGNCPIWLDTITF